jgi:hypothetical protein
MKYSFAAVLAVAATASAWANDTVVYTTEVVDVYTTVCPATAAITFNGHTYTNTLTEVRRMAPLGRFCERARKPTRASSTRGGLQA